MKTSGGVGTSVLSCIALVLALAGVAPATAAPATGYYAAAEGRTGESLRTALHGIISRQSTVTYAQVWEALEVTDQDPANSANVVLLYSGASRSKARSGGSVGDWNREHVWPRSRGGFGTATGPGTDLHHLRPSDVQVNSTRGNKDFDLGGSAVSGCTGCRTDADSFEPSAGAKGDVVRMIMYMAIRYEGGDGWADLEANESTSNGTSPRVGRMSVLLAWHEQDPPSAFERRRNDLIDQRYQGTATRSSTDRSGRAPSGVELPPAAEPLASWHATDALR